MTKPIERTNDCSNRQKPCKHGPMHNYWCCFVHQGMPEFSAQKCSPGIIPKGAPKAAGDVLEDAANVARNTVGYWKDRYEIEHGEVEALKAQQPPSTGLEALEAITNEFWFRSMGKKTQDLVWTALANDVPTTEQPVTA